MAAQREYSSSFFGCCDPFGLACLTCWCPCITYGKTHARLQDPSLNSYSAFNGSCLAYTALQCLGGFGCVLNIMQRGELRHRFNLKGDGCTDFLKACCCPCCDLMQQEKEVIKIQAETQPILGNQPKVEGGMVYAQPGQPAPGQY